MNRMPILESKIVWRWSSGLFRDRKIACLQTSLPRLWVTKIIGRDSASIISAVKSFRIFVAWSASLFDDATDVRNTYAS